MTDAAGPGPVTAWSFSFTAVDGRPLPLSVFAGKALLVVNTASKCGFTPQYRGLESLFEQLGDRGLVVLGVPSNDFGGQEPGSAGDIQAFCREHYAIRFPLTDKTCVTGDGAHPFYRWAGRHFGPWARPRWNFHKYLVAPDGRLADWFSTITSPEAPRLVRAVERLLPA